MANRMFKPLGGSLTQEVICLTGKCSFLADATMDINETTTVGIAVSSVLSVGDGVAGTGIPAGATVVSIESATSMTISAAATATTTNVSDGMIALNSGSPGFSIGSTNAAGEQVLTLDDTYNDLVGVNITYQGDGGFAAAESTIFELDSETVSSSKTITIQHIEASDGTVQTQANLNGKTVRCMIWLKNSSV